MLLDSAELTRCRHRVSLEHIGIDPPGTVDPAVRQRQDEAAAHRRRVAELLAAGSPSWVEVPAELPPAERRERTRQAVASGAERIWGATLGPDRAAHRRGRADLLVRHAGGYVPVIVVNHRTTDPGRGARTSELLQWAPRLDETRNLRSFPRDQLRLAHLTRMLQTLGAASAEQVGGVIGLDADCVVVHDLAAATWPGGRSTLQEYDTRFADRLAVATGQVPTSASRIGECRTCPWWPRCSADLRESRDVSLVVAGPQVSVLRALGVRTVDELATWAGPGPAAWPGGAFADAVVLARAWLRGVPLVRRTEHVQVHRADVEVDVDMESYLEHGAYLWGALLSEPGQQSVYHPFVTWEPVPTEDEARSFGEFWTWLMQVRADAAAQGRTFAAYCYSEAAENRWLLASARRFAGHPGVPTEAQVREFIGSEQWVDVYAAVGTAFLCPLGKGLKKVAPVAGFTWRDAEASGAASMGWYRKAVGLDGDAPDLAQRRRLLDYNADDVWATRVLREWMSGPAEREVPLASEL